MDDLDDLFRDAGPTAQSQPSGLHDRVDELRRIGCCDKLAWAPSGVLAFVAEDDINVHFKTYHYASGESKWVPKESLGTPLPMQIRKMFEGSQIVHISFNPYGNGNEFLVVDIFGRIFCTGPLNTCFDKFQVQYAFNSYKSDLSRVVGMMWLPAARESMTGFTYYKEAHRQGSAWIFPKPEPVVGCKPYNPIQASAGTSTGRPAFLALTAAGKLTLYYNKSDAKPTWEVVSHDLFHTESSSLVLSHAAISCAPGDNTPSGDVWIAAVDTSNQVHIRVVAIKWPLQQPQQPASTVTAHISHAVTGALGSVEAHVDDGGPDDNAPTRVSFVKLAVNRTAPQGARTHLQLLIGSHILPRAGVQNMSASRPQRTVIARYDLHSVKPEVDSCFSALSAKQTARNAVKPQLAACRLEDQRFDGIVLDVREHRHGSMLSFAYSDGKIEYRNMNMQIPPLEISNDSITSLPSIGFSFNDDEPCLHNIPSQHGCLRAIMGTSRKPKIQPIQASVPLMEVTDPDFKAKTAAVFALELLNTGNNSELIDIIVAMRALSRQLQPEQADNFRFKVLQNYGVLGAQLTQKLAEPAEKLITMAPLVRLLSLQETFGHGGESDCRSPPALVAWIILNLRQCFMYLLASTSPAPGQPQNKPRILQPDVTECIGDSVRWFTCLVDWLVEQILLLNRQMNYPKMFTNEEIPFEPHELPQHAPTSTHVACTLLGAPLGRNLLKGITHRIAGLQKNLFANLDPQDMGPEWSAWQRAEEDSVMPLLEFHKFLNSCDNVWQKIYKSQGPAGEPLPLTFVREQEMTLLATAMLNNQYNVHFMAQLSTAGAWNLRACCDEAKLAFRDYTLLGFGMDTAARDSRARFIWDGGRKKILGNRASTELPDLKSCTRCGNVTVDSLRSSPVLAQWMMMTNSRCFCGGYWMTTPNELQVQ